MSEYLKILFFSLCYSWLYPAFSQFDRLTADMPSGIFASDSSVLISSYFNALDPRDEWTELLVVGDNIDMRNWTLQDNNSAQTTFQPLITFNNIPFWNNMRAGTIIMIWHRQFGSSGTPHPASINKTTGYIEMYANDVAYFTGGAFGTAPTFAGATLNIAGAGDLLQLLTSSGVFVHALGHKSTFGNSWAPLSLPKLNHKASLSDGEAVYICPGSKVDEYGHTAPQDGTTWTAKSNTDLSFGLPNCPSATSANSDYWRLVRQPKWNSPLLTGFANQANTQVTLNWNASADPNPSDGTQGYLILRNSTNTFGTPVDGHIYTPGDNLGGAMVLAVLSSSQTITYADNTTIPCSGGTFYRIYAFRYIQDALGNDYNLARGRAYNETHFGSVQVTYPAAIAPTAASVDRNNFCADDPGNITLSATGGSGSTLNWFEGSCGGILVGAGSGTNNSITIPSPVFTTTYYARWENACGASACADVTVTVLPGAPVSISISASANPVCTGTSVTFTAAPVNPGTSPGYQWKVNGLNAGAGSPTYTYVPNNGDDVTCVLTSNASCVSNNPATSNNIIMTVTSSIPVSVTITASENPVCTGTAVTFTAVPVNPGTSPGYQWKVNGLNAGAGSPTYTYVPNNGDDVTCVLTSNASCGSGSPATSNNIIMSVSSVIPVSLSIVASVNPVCMGNPVTFTATPANPGTAPAYQWKVNGIDAGTGSPVFTYIPFNGDIVSCILSSNASCGTGSPATSNSIIMMVSSDIPVSVTISASENPVCSGTPVTFTAIPTNPGTAPAYQWKVNGSNTGANNPVFSFVPAEGDVVTCILTSNASCASANQATSNSIVMSVSSAMPLSVVVDANPGVTICQGTVVTFTATAENGGSSPAFQWRLNGNPTGGNSPIWSTAPANGDLVSCVVTSNASCATNNPATSNTMTMAVTPALVAEVSVTADHDAICQGTEVTFTASALHEGSAPVYEWLVNGLRVQQGASPEYITATIQAGQQVICRLTSSLTCVAQQTITSVPLSLSAAAPPGVKLSEKGYLCAGSTTPLDAGADFSSYSWQDGSTGRYMNIAGEGLYWVVVADTLHCIGSDTVRVQKCAGNIYVPNAFSPNGDGLNDIFRVFASPDDVAEFNMQVFNRWGEQVFESNYVLTGWDGMKAGTYCPAASYVWKINYKVAAAGSAGETVTQTGTLELVR